MSRGKHFIAQREWMAIETRLRKLGAPDCMFNADFDNQVEAAVQRFEAVQDEREAAGLERTPLPDDPRELVPGQHPAFLRPLRYSLREWVKQPRKDAKRQAKIVAARESRGGEYTPPHD